MLRYAPFLLLAALLLMPTAASAQMYLPAPVNAAALKWHTVTFQYAKPGDVLKLMGYTGDALPAGVAQILVLPDTGALQIDANDAGFSAFRDRLNATLNIGPDHIRLKIVVASLPKRRQIDVDLSNPSRALMQMREAGAAFYTLPPATVTNRTLATFPVAGLPGNDNFADANAVKAVPALYIQPSITDDNFVFLDVNYGTPSGAFTINIGTTMDAFAGKPSGMMTVYDGTGFLSSAANRVLVFVTPTVIESTVNHGEAITVTP
jgi:hypothetical protein